jgi:hypothetical protein
MVMVQIKSYYPQERGSVVVLVTLALTALLGFCALVTDVGLMYAQKAHLQNSVDAAALAGVQELPNDPSLAEQRARDYASRNGAPAVTVSFEANNYKIVVQATQQVPTYFARIWGITEEQISVSAKAMTVPLTGIKGAVPLSIMAETQLNYGVSYELKFGAHSGETGWYGGLDLRCDNNSGKMYNTDLEFGYPGTLSVGDPVNELSGVKTGPTADAIANRISPDSTNTFDDHDRNATEIMYIPIITADELGKMKIVGFAAFYIDRVNGKGDNSIITGRFLKKIPSNDHTNVSLSELLQTEYDMEHGGVVSTDSGVYTTKLVKN